MPQDFSKSYARCYVPPLYTNTGTRVCASNIRHLLREMQGKFSAEEVLAGSQKRQNQLGAVWEWNFRAEIHTMLPDARNLSLCMYVHTVYMYTYNTKLVTLGFLWENCVVRLVQCPESSSSCCTETYRRNWIQSRGVPILRLNVR